jgi:Uma2 family endonuclease
MYAMSGGTLPHAVIIGNCHAALHFALRKSDCSVVSSDMRVRVAPEGLYTYPDVVVVCGEAQLADKHRDTLLNPTVLVEVLSKSTEAYDRGFKSAQYRTIESLQEYAFVSQTEPRVEIYRRQPEGWLLTESVGLDAVCRFGSLDCEVPLSDIYDKVNLEPTPEPML